jgi:hypothetical protein
MGQWPSSNWTNADEYDCSGTPWVTSSNGTEVDNSAAIRVKFPRVTRWIQVFNNNTTAAHTLKIGFTASGVEGPDAQAYNITGSNANYFLLAGATNSGRMETRCLAIYLLAGTANDVDISVMAGLTNIPPNNMFPLTGSAEIQGVG